MYYCSPASSRLCVDFSWGREAGNLRFLGSHTSVDEPDTAAAIGGSRVFPISRSTPQRGATASVPARRAAHGVVATAALSQRSRWRWNKFWEPPGTSYRKSKFCLARICASGAGQPASLPRPRGSGSGASYFTYNCAVLALTPPILHVIGCAPADMPVGTCTFT